MGFAKLIIYIANRDFNNSTSILYTYKFLRYVNYADVKNPPFHNSILWITCPLNLLYAHSLPCMLAHVTYHTLLVFG